VASHSNTFTATAVLRLAERGRLRLDDTPGGHLPWVEQDSPSFPPRPCVNSWATPRG